MVEENGAKRGGIWSQILPYGLALGFGLAAIKLMEFSFSTRDIGLEVYLGFIALLFLVVGILFGRRFFRVEPVDQEAALPDFRPIERAPQTPPGGDLSAREMEVLVRLAEGATNREIAEVLFLSPNTIKSHVANIYRKLEVSRRPQAVTRARELGILR